MDYLENLCSDDLSDNCDLSVEAQVARNLGDPDWEDLATEVPPWRIGGTRARTYESDKLTFDDAPDSERNWRN